jgi:hypothetical protein
MTTKRGTSCWLLFAASACALAASTVLGRAEGKGPDFVPQFQVIETTQAAKVVFVPEGTAFRGRLNEAQLNSWGCTLTTRDPARIASLIDLLKRSEIRLPHNAHPDWLGEPREAIYLTLSNGDEVKFLFSRAFLNVVGVTGLFTYLPKSEGLPVTGASSLPRELAVWAGDTGPIWAEASHNQQACEYYIEKAKKSRCAAGDVRCHVDEEIQRSKK